ncbi:3'(2'),5'-bisphosphate nucleotidase CysQ [Roseospira marina]|uniref:3'(2'),5'-bisphosphate nucleotidase CysQ n=1 Tax=Roseospira marina TaxID=140057 RepID=A0A5M6ICH7_9PROT|nr:3'(2'),5'-bisphosphate nucleotidase CysQ [Roseospira marina]KAA5605936.1 3'(2'),5'-bisphosphate nucleotidase CysQ [Roseospira marina]MBB4313221.1 3'(2'), 5'-bisphosphate nucleotidase [Roseospira marina]MBB5086038.1 3'(2'), 5'-bisphosphate nucleotidase [Roseospira marina]
MTTSSVLSFDGAALARLAEALRPVIRAAGDAVMEVYASDFAVEHKEDKSPVTEADGRAEAIILAALKELTPDVPVVAEESVSEGRVPTVGDGPFWLVDPLDGTKEFIKRNGEFTVNIGLVDGRTPILGLVLAPALGTLYVGHGLGTACMAEKDGAERPIACRKPGAEGLVVLASRSHGDGGAMDSFLAKYTVADRVGAGSSLKFCRVAEGAADLYPRLAPTCEWDTAAAHAVLLAAGGSVETEDGAPLGYAKNDRFLNPHFIARGAWRDADLGV